MDVPRLKNRSLVLILSYTGTRSFLDLTVSDDLFLTEYSFKYIWCKIDQNERH